LESIEEVAAEIEETKKAIDIKQEQIILPIMSPEEEKIIEDVLREFFA